MFTVLGLETNTGEGKVSLNINIVIQFNLSKVITISPRYIVKNNLDDEIECRVFKVTESLIIPPNKYAPLYDLFGLDQLLMSLKTKNIFDEWSSPFNFNNLGKVFVKLMKVSLKAEILLRIDIVMEGPTIFISVSKETSMWPYRIDNSSDVDVVVYQMV